MISILRPSTPPLALISSAASCAACGIDEPATDCASEMTPILIGGLVCAAAGAASASTSAAAPPVRMARNGVVPDLTGRCIARGLLGESVAAAIARRDLLGGLCERAV